MYIQQIKQKFNPNFNGRLGYAAKNGEKYFDNVKNHLPHVYEEFRKAVQDTLRDEPFDVFISRDQTPLHFNIQTTDGKLKTYPQKVILNPKEKYYYNNDEDLAIAIFRSISDFKKGNFSK